MAGTENCGGVLREVLERCAAWGAGKGLPADLDVAFEVEVEPNGPSGGGEQPLRVEPGRVRSDIEGPAHVACRALPRLHDADGRYCGEGLLELSLPAPGTLMVGAALRVVCPDGRFRLRRAGLRLAAGKGWQPVAPKGLAAGGPPLPLAGAGNLAVVRRGGEFLGVWWGAEPPLWCETLGGEGLWAPWGAPQQAPYYQSWESHLRQWPRPRGWQARDGSAVTAADDGLLLAWRLPGLAPSETPDGPLFNCSGVAAVLCASSEEEVRRLAAALASPPAAEASGAVPVGFDQAEGSWRFRRTAARCAVSFPPDPLQRHVLVRLDGPPTAAAECAVDGRKVLPQLVSLGRTDDPNGTDDGRPDCNARPVLASRGEAAERIELSLRLSADRPTRLEAAETDGLSLSWLAQDDRRELLLFSSQEGGRPIGRLSLHDLRLRDLRLPGADWPAAACLPLYWYLMNAPSPWHSANLLRSLEVRENGPGAVRLAASSVNPDGALLSSCEAGLRLSASGWLCCDIATRLEVRGRFPAPHLQFLNLFPEATWDSRRWLRDRTLLAWGSFLRAVDNRENDGGLKHVPFELPCFAVQYPDGRRPGGAQGLLAVLIDSVEVRPRTAGTELFYELCRCWLDNHFNVRFPEGGPEPGSVFEARYRIVLAPGVLGDREAEAWAARALASGRLEP